MVEIYCHFKILVQPKMNVLSLFDGMSCGQLALQRAGIEVTKYFASEIDKYAITVTMANFPNTIQLGDDTTSSQTIAKPNVSGSLHHPIKFGRWLLKYAKECWDEDFLCWQYEGKFYNTDEPKTIMQKYIGKRTQTIHPWQFGHGETKETWLWLKGFPKLEPTEIVEGRENKIWKMPPSKDRGKLRSKTYPGIAKVISVQWF